MKCLVSRLVRGNFDVNNQWRLFLIGCQFDSFLRRIEMTDQEKDAEKLVPLLPSRKVLFREHGEMEWRQHHFTILGQAALLDSPRSSRSMYLMLSTNIDGFRSTEIIGLDLFAAIASAMLTVESLIIMLQQTGEVRLRENFDFDIASDSVFFGGRAKKLREQLKKYIPEDKDPDSK